MNLAEFKIKFNTIKEKGYLPSTRKGSTGIGHTLETHLGIVENNLAQADIEGIELKAHRAQSNNLITLFTFNNKVWVMPPIEAIKKYGSYDENGRQGIYYTMSLKPNSAGLFLDVQKTDISVRHISGAVVATWSLQKLAERFMQKIPALLLVSAFTEERAGIEYFHYYRAQLMKGASADILANQFKSETILVDLRLHDKGTMARNHGTGFRAYEDKLPLLFQSIEVL